VFSNSFFFFFFLELVYRFCFTNNKFVIKNQNLWYLFGIGNKNHLCLFRAVYKVSQWPLAWVRYKSINLQILELFSLVEKDALISFFTFSKKHRRADKNHLLS